MVKRRRGDSSALTLRAETEAEVTRWVWATGPLHHPLPLWPERLGIPRGKALRRAPAKKGGAYAFGFDAAGRLLIERHHTEIPGQFHEELFRHDGDRIEVAVIAAGESVIGATAVLFQAGGRPISYERTGAGWTIRETYAYEDGRLVRIEAFASNATPTTRIYQVAWDDDALRSIAEVSRAGKLHLVYEAPRAADPPRAALELALERLLVEHVPKVVARAGITEPAYCVALVYDAEGSILPPELAVGLERQRLSWVDKHGKDAIVYLWSPEDFERFADGTLNLDEREVRATSSALLRRLEHEDALGAAIPLLARAARKLAAIDWRPVLPVTDDFVVVPVRLEGGIRSEDLAVSMSRSRRTALTRKGFL